MLVVDEKLRLKWENRGFIYFSSVRVRGPSDSPRMSAMTRLCFPKQGAVEKICQSHRLSYFQEVITGNWELAESISPIGIAFACLSGVEILKDSGLGGIVGSCCRHPSVAPRILRMTTLTLKCGKAYPSHKSSQYVECDNTGYGMELNLVAGIWLNPVT